MYNADEKMSKQYIWIIRYGLTEYQLVENEGPFNSDIHPEDGVEAANCIAGRIASSENGAPSIVYSSPFQRTAHTANILASALRNDNNGEVTRLNIEEGLTEWQVPSLLVNASSGMKAEPESVKDLKKKFDCIDPSYTSLNPVIVNGRCDVVRKGAPCFTESEEQLLKRAKVTISKILEHSKGKNLAIVSHAPVDQALAYVLESGGDAIKSEKSQIGPWPLGGITLFSRNVLEQEWKLEFYGDTDHMPGIYKPGLKHWSLPCLSRS